MPRENVTIFEASDRFGGLLQTTRRDGFLIDHAADNFIVNEELPWAGDLCQQIGLELIQTNSQHSGALILRGRRLHRIPEGLHLLSVTQLIPLLASPLLSWRGKLRVACEPFVPRRRDNVEESLTQFTTRRLGREMFDRIVQALVAGIYTADPDKLSVAAALPQFVAMERKHGSLARAAVAHKKGQGGTTSADRGARYSLFRAPRHGMQTLIDKIVSQLDGADLRLNMPVSELEQQANDDGWQLKTAGGNHAFDSVLLATSAPAAAKLLSPVASELADPIAEIEHATTSVVCLGFKRNQIRHPMNAFGCVIPSIEKRRILAVSFSSVKFAHRAPEDHVLLRVFVGGALQAELAELPDDELIQLVREELSDLLGVEGSPSVQQIVRWPKTTPQYYLGHVERLGRIQEQIQRLPHLALAGNAYQGVGIPQCIRSAWNAVDQLLNGSV